MLLAQGVGLIDMLFVLLYLLVTAYLGWLGYRHTRGTADYLVAGRKVHPFIMAMSYGATFISTSAIVGFGGVAGMFGMSLLWLVFLNIFVGIFVAFIFLGSPTRRMGQALDAHTFPEFLGRRYQSKGIQVFAGSVIFLFIPLYAAAVLIGGCLFIKTQFGVPYETALLVFSAIIAVYVIAGGLKGVMYTDALQGTVMVIGMLILLIYTYTQLGGVTEAHTALTDLSDLAGEKIRAEGNLGWMSMPAFGWGSPLYNQWWTVVSAITLGVGIGVVAQPQLVVRFMTVKSKRELNRAVVYGGLFILLIPGVAYTVGSLSNAWFVQHGPLIQGRVVQMIDEPRGHVMLQPMRQDESKRWIDVAGAKPVPAVLDAKNPYLADVIEPGPGRDLVTSIAEGRSVALTYAGSKDEIIPTFISQAMPPWFGMLFLLTLLSAAMSTLSSQFHTSGTAIGRDIYEQIAPRHAGSSPGRSVLVVRVGIIVGILIAVAIAHFPAGEMVIARFTAIFFGLCSATFLPAYIGGLFFRRMTRPAAIASMIVGLVVSLAWLLLVKSAEAGQLGLVKHLTGGKSSILDGVHNWPMVDAVVIALPLSVLTAVAVSLLTQPPGKEHLDRCFPGRSTRN